MTTIQIEMNKMNLSHELKTSLTGILSSMELLKTTCLSSEQKTLIDVAFNASCRLLKIGNQIVDGVVPEKKSESTLFFTNRFQL